MSGNLVKKNISKNSINRVKIATIYWVNVGQNVGGEIYGKGDEFLRLVLVLNTIYIKGFISAFVGVPLSSQTKNKSGYLYHKFITTNDKKQIALLGR